MSDILTVICGDALTELRELPSESVQCCVTSPPYWGLRDYGTAQWEGGDDRCDHRGRERYYTEKTAAVCSHDAFMEPGKANADRLKQGRWREAGDCKCGAKRIDWQIGLEKTPEEYVAKMVEVFREVRRVLRGDGTLWLNLGDGYARNGGTGNCGPNAVVGNTKRLIQRRNCKVPECWGLKDKNLMGLPWRVAFALQADGWWLRSDIIWAKPNCMPESVRDRPTRSHEYLFLLTKSANYFYDAEAIKEPASESDWESRIGRANLNNKLLPTDEINGIRPRVKYTPNGKDKQRGHSRRHDGFNDRWDKMERAEQCSGMRNKRDVWTVAPANYPEAHFATYPPSLIKPCILAGSKPGDVVLDMFAGSGTTGMVALDLGRKALLIELNPEYCKLIEQRCSITPGLELA